LTLSNTRSILVDVALAERDVGVVALRELASKTAPVALAEERVLPIHADLEPLFPTAGLKRGATISVTGSLGLALRVIAGPSQAGAWCASVGIPSLGLVAAMEAGIDLARFPMVADPGDDWATVTAALLDAFDVVLLGPPPRRRGPNRRLEARARERGAVLVIAGDWPGADVRLSVARSEWEGLGDGHGHLRRHRLEVVATGRRAAARERRAEIVL
jgi:hypothetical protein